MTPVHPTAWRIRHDDFAAAVHDLRMLAPERDEERFAAHLRALDEALRLHMSYEETELLPPYADVAPSEGQGSPDAVRRDHELIRGHLGALQAPPSTAAEQLGRADRLAKFEGVLEHHDKREGRFVFPVLEELGLQITLDEPELPRVVLRPALSMWPVNPGLQGAAEALAQDGEVHLPAAPKAGRIERHAAQARRALELRDAAVTLFDRREAGLRAFDAVARWRWMTAG